MKRGIRRPLVRAVERTGLILETLLAHPRGLRLVDLSDLLGLHKTTVLRLLRTLVEMRLVRKDEASDRYCWEPLHWLFVAWNVQEGYPRRQIVQGLLTTLAEATGQTAVLSVPGVQRRTMLIVAWALPNTPMKLDVAQHSRIAPLHRVPAGLVQLAHMPEEEAEAYLAAMESPAQPSQLRAELARIRARGWATTVSGFIPGAGAVSVPVADEQEEVVASLDLAGPQERLTEENVADWLPRMRETAERLSRFLYEFSARSPGREEETPEGAKNEEVAQSETEFHRDYRIL